MGYAVVGLALLALGWACFCDGPGIDYHDDPAFDEEYPYQ